MKKKWIRTESGYLFDFYNEISRRVIQDVTNNGVSVFFAMALICKKIKIILSVCATLITIDDNLCYFMIMFFSRGVELASLIMLLCFLLVVLSGICVRQAHNQPEHLPPTKFSKHCISILTFTETVK